MQATGGLEGLARSPRSFDLELLKRFVTINSEDIA